MVKLTRRSVVQVAVEGTYGVPESLGDADGVLVSEPDYQLEPTNLDRNIATPDLSPQATSIGRLLASMSFSTELRSNGKTTGQLADAPMISRLFRGCGYALREVSQPEVLGVHDIDAHANEVSWGVSSGDYAEADLEFTDQPANGETVVIGGVTYTFKTTIGSAANDVKIGANVATSIGNLAAAIVRGSGAGTSYSEATVAHPQVTATASSDKLTVTARQKGVAGNAIAVSDTVTDASWDSPTLTGGQDIAANTDLHNYIIEITTGGASGAAKYLVKRSSSPGLTEWVSGSGTPGTLTSGSEIDVGPDGLKLKPTFTGELVEGQSWSLWLLPTGLLLQPVSEEFESLTIGMNRDGTYHLMPGAFGTFSISAPAGEYATVSWNFTGAYRAPEDAPMAAPVYEKTKPSKVEYARLRIGGFYAVVQEFSFDQGNQINVRPDVSSDEGYIGTRITSRAPEGGINPEVTTVAENDFWSHLGSARSMPFQMRVGTEPGNRIWFLAPNTQYTGLTYQDRDGVLAFDAGLRFNRYFGDDEVFFFIH